MNYKNSKRNIKQVSVYIGKDITKAKALITICYGLGVCSYYNYSEDGKPSDLDEALEFAEDCVSNGYDKYLLIGGAYGIDFGKQEGKLLKTVEEVFTYLNSAREPVVVKINNQYSAIIGEEGIEVGCQFITYEKLEEVMTAAGYEFQ